MVHELIAGAASYEVRVMCNPPSYRIRSDRRLQAAKAYENHVAENGQPPSHEKAKEILYVL